MTALLWLVSAAALSQPAPESPGGVVSQAQVVAQPAPKPPSVLPGFDLGGPLNILYTQPPPVGKKNPSPDSAPDEKAKAGAGDEAAGPSNQAPWYSIHGQSTFIYQGNFPLHSPYQGPNSLLGNSKNAETATGTLYFDVRPWQGGEIIFNPEFSGGEGLDGTLGLAGFPNGEATRVGKVAPTAYVARALYRHTWQMDGEWEKLEDDQNQIAGPRSRNRFSITVGKMAAEDVLDDNAFSHDPRTQFLNWGLMYTGAWDYPANARGYTYGVLFDYTTMFYSVRYGIFAEPVTANDQAFDPHFLDAHGQILELQENFILGDHPAHWREWIYANNAHMGKYRDALAEMPVDPDITQTRAYRIKYGVGTSFDKEITRDLGFFVRAGWNDGQSETWAFTEIDATGAVGLLLKGRAWGRPQDEVGLAGLINGLSDAHKDYLAAGGLGFIIGDGRLRYGPEEIVETYYNWEAKKGINITLDFQGVNHPAYNQDRGPVAILALRAHLAF